MTDARLGIGGNNPPPPTPFESVTDEIDGLYDESLHWLDGSTVQSQTEADAVSKLLGMAREAAKRADEARRDEKRPHDDAAAAVQRRYKPLAEKADRIAAACKQALTPWLERAEAEKRAIAEYARREAEEKIAAAQQAIQASRDAGLAQREQAEILLADAKRAETIAAKAEKDKAAAKGGARAVTLRSQYVAEIVDVTAFARWVWTHQKDELTVFLGGIAQRHVDAKFCELPGVVVHEVRSAV